MKRKPFTRGLTECWRGHAFTSENTYVRPDGSRNCLTCKRQIMRDWFAKLKARRAA